MMIAKFSAILVAFGLGSAADASLVTVNYGGQVDSSTVPGVSESRFSGQITYDSTGLPNNQQFGTAQFNGIESWTLTLNDVSGTVPLASTIILSTKQGGYFDNVLWFESFGSFKPTSVVPAFNRVDLYLGQAKPGVVPYPLALPTKATLADFGFASLQFYDTRANKYTVLATVTQFDLAVASVPETKSWALLIAGFVAVGVFVRRSRTLSNASR